MNSSTRTHSRCAITLLLGLGACLALAGCGQKGNLYLPNQKKKVPATQPQPESQPANSSGGSSSGAQ
jgi:predicted small lipoprotein YifL